MSLAATHSAPASRPSPLFSLKRVKGMGKWLPALAALAVVGCAALFAAPSSTPSLGRRSLTAQSHHAATFSDHPRMLASSAASPPPPTSSKNWFNDAVSPVSSVGHADVGRRNAWGTARTYAPAISGESPESRKLYDGHVDVSDQFTTFGKTLIGLQYFVFWCLLMFPNYIIPLGRPAISIGGGMLTIIIRYCLYVAGQGPVFHAEDVMIMEPLFLLFGLMLTTIYLERMESGGMFDKIRGSLDDPINYKRVLKIIGVASIGSAAVMNDSIVLIFSGVVVDLCVRHKSANSTPYLLALATACNIGSSLTMTGNPQNILIVSLMYDDIGWLDFAANMLLPTLAGSLVNAGAMLLFYRRELFPGTNGAAEAVGVLVSGSKTAEMLSLERAYFARKAASAGGENEIKEGWTLWSKLQLIVVIAFLICFAAGLDVSVVCISAGVVLMTLTAWKRYSFDEKVIPFDPVTNEPIDPKKIYDIDGNELEPEEEEMITESETTLTEVDYGLLLLFIGQFLLIGSFDDTGIPQAFFRVTMGDCSNDMTGGSCVYWFVTIITVLSNVASNVPVCQMLAATFPYASPYEWLQVSFSATVAGNLTMLGSAANMIVAFQSAKVGDRTFTSERHVVFGAPSTILVLYLGTFILASLHWVPNCSVKLGECDAEAAA